MINKRRTINIFQSNLIGKMLQDIKQIKQLLKSQFDSESISFGGRHKNYGKVFYSIPLGKQGEIRARTNDH